jgi:hypothetical protein
MPRPPARVIPAAALRADRVDTGVAEVLPRAPHRQAIGHEGPDVPVTRLLPAAAVVRGLRGPCETAAHG